MAVWHKEKEYGDNYSEYAEYWVRSPGYLYTMSDYILTTSKLGKALEAVQDIMWGQSANAVIFCALRDKHGYADNMSQYERDWKIMAGEYRLSCQCPEGTLRAAFRDNPYLKLPVEKWSSNGAPDRAIMLIEKFEESIL